MAEQILDVFVPEMVEQKLPNTVPQDRIRQRTVETPDVNVAEKIVERHVIQTQQVVNKRVQHVVPLVLIVKKTVEVPEVPLLQFNDKVVDILVVARREVSQLQ